MVDEIKRLSSLLNLLKLITMLWLYETILRKEILNLGVKPEILCVTTSQIIQKNIRRMDGWIDRARK